MPPPLKLFFRKQIKFDWKVLGFILFSKPTNSTPHQCFCMLCFDVRVWSWSHAFLVHLNYISIGKKNKYFYANLKLIKNKHFFVNSTFFQQNPSLCDFGPVQTMHFFLFSFFIFFFRWLRISLNCLEKKRHSAFASSCTIGQKVQSRKSNKNV